MKHSRPDYNERIQDSANLIPADEPVFLLRAQDKHAPATVRGWAARVEKEEGITEIVMAALSQAKEMEGWQKMHGQKQPDLLSENLLRD